MHSCQYLRLNCNQPAEPWSNNSCQSACLHFLKANSLMHRTELRLSQRNRHCVERSSSLCMPSFMKSSLASWRTRMTLRDTEMLSNQSRKFLLQLSGLFWSLCGSMLISLRGRSVPGFTDGRRADMPPSPWTGPNQPENVDNVGSAWLQGDKHTGDLNQRAEADRCAASLQRDQCSAARWQDQNSNREEEFNSSPYFTARWITSFLVSPNLLQSLDIGWSGYGVKSVVIKRMCSFDLSVTESTN